MPKPTFAGLLTAALTLICDRFIHPLSHTSAIVLYLLAILLTVGGMVAKNKICSR